MNEKQIEDYLRNKVKAAGGLCYKFVSPGNPGVPDRIVILPGGRTIYVELKAEFGRLRNLQKWQLECMRKLGAEVRVLQGLPQVKEFLKEVFGA